MERTHLISNNGRGKGQATYEAILTNAKGEYKEKRQAKKVQAMLSAESGQPGP